MMFSNSNGILKNLDKMPPKSYMENQEVPLHKTYFLIRFSDHAIRPSKNCSHIRWEKPDPLWRNIFTASFLQTDTITPPFISKANIYSTQQSLTGPEGHFLF